MAVYRLGSTFIPSIVHRFSQVIVGQHFAEDHLVAVNLLDQRCPGPPLLAGQALLKGPYLDLLGLRQRSQNNLGVSILCPKPVRLHVVAEREKAALQGPLRDDLVAVRGLKSQYHNNVIKFWQVTADGSVKNVEA